MGIESQGGTRAKHAITTEELAIQKFVEKLIREYKYPKEHIVTSPQYRVKESPSDKRGYPVDIAVFESAEKKNEQLKIIVECKASNITSGKTQLKSYLKFSEAEIGVWFNGEELVTIRKYIKSGKTEYYDIPDMPKFGEQIEEIGMYRRKDLTIPHNLKDVFKEIRHRLAGSMIGTTRDEELAKGMINLILCKLYDEKYTEPDEMLCFRAVTGEKPDKVFKRIRELFSAAGNEYKDVFEKNDKIGLDAEHITYTHELKFV